MKNENQQREVSSCCGAEVEQTECFCPGSTDLKHDQLICKKCEKRCDSKPQDHIGEANEMVAGEQDKTHYHTVKTNDVFQKCVECGFISNPPVQPTPEETRQTGSEGWVEGLDDIIGHIPFDQKDYEKLEQFICDLLAAKEEEMESKNRQDKPTLHVPSETISMEDHNKRIIEAVEKTEGIVKELSQSFFDLTNRHFPDDMSVNIKVVNAKELLGKLADFKREYGGKE